MTEIPVRRKTYDELQRQVIDLTTQLVLTRIDLQNEKESLERWRKEAEGYYDIRSWLRLCDNTPEGHAEFYKECSEVIFPV